MFHLAPNHLCSIILCKSALCVRKHTWEKHIDQFYWKHHLSQTQLSIVNHYWSETWAGLSVFNHWHWFNNYGFNDSSSTTSKIIIAIAIIIIFKLPSVKASHHRLQEIIRAERQRGQNNLNQSPDFCQSWWCWWWWWWWQWWRWFWWWCWWWCSLM